MINYLVKEYIDYLQEQKSQKYKVHVVSAFRNVKPHLNDMIKTMNDITKKILKNIKGDIKYIPLSISKIYKNPKSSNEFIIPGTIFPQNLRLVLQNRFAKEVSQHKSNWEVVKYERIETTRHSDYGLQPFDIKQDYYICYVTPAKRLIKAISDATNMSNGSIKLLRKGQDIHLSLYLPKLGF